jgi:predicted nucleic acid-binding protein
MPKAISNTSPLLYLYRVGKIEWLPRLFDEVWTPEAVKKELLAGQSRGYDVPDPTKYKWLRIVNPISMPSEWLALDLGAGELAAMALALENPQHIILLDDMLARRTAIAAGLQVWGTLKILLEAKSQGLVSKVEPVIDHLNNSGMWISNEVKQRILILAGEIDRPKTGMVQNRVTD